MIDYEKLDKLYEKINALRKILDENPNDDKLWIELGILYHHADEIAKIGPYWEKSLECLRKATVINPANPDAWSALGNYYFIHKFAKDNWKNAGISFKKALELNPNHFHALGGLSSWYAEKKKWKDAIKYLKRLVNAYAEDIEALILLACYQGEAKDLDGCLISLKKAIKLDSSMTIEAMKEEMHGSFKKLKNNEEFQELLNS